MKKLILTAAFMFIAATAQAMMIMDVEYTGVLRERIDLCGYACGPVYGTYYESNLMSAGGSVANNSMGYAQNFNVYDETRIDYLLASARILGGWSDSGIIEHNQLNFKLYTGSNTSFLSGGDIFPDTSKMALLAQMDLKAEIGLYPDDPTLTTDGIYKDFPLLFGITLAPGNYWIAQERYPGNENLAISWSLADNISVKFARDELANIHTPEPATIMLFGFGLLGAFVRRRFV